MTITTVLLDLDNTLLGNPMSAFLPAYFETAQTRFSHSIASENLREAMIAAVHTTQSGDILNGNAAKTRLRPYRKT